MWAGARGAPALNEAAERMVEAAILSRRYPEARIAFSGGDAGILYSSSSEAEGAAVAADRARRCASDRLILEAKSRDTYENAAFLKAELTRKGELGPGKRWLLITSAYHMPRAIGAFRKAGFDVEAWPVDYRTRGQRRLDAAFRQGLGGLAAGGRRHARMVRASRLLAQGAKRCAVSGAPAARRRRLRPGATGGYAVRQPASIPMSTQPLR